MKLSKALKEKNKLIKEIAQTKAQLSENSFVEGNTTYYKTSEVLIKLEELKKKLVELKASIQKANGPILEKIYQIAEHKDSIGMLRAMSTHEGTHQERGYGAPTTPVKMICQVNRVEVAKLIQGMENRIEVLQEEIEAHNHATTI